MTAILSLKTPHIGRVAGSLNGVDRVHFKAPQG